MIAAIARGDVENQAVRNQTLGQVYGMFDKQNDNMRADQQLLAQTTLAQQKQYYENLSKMYEMNENFEQANLARRHADRVTTQMMADRASAASGFAGANANNTLAQQRLGEGVERLETDPNNPSKIVVNNYDLNGKIRSTRPATTKDLGAEPKTPKDLAADALRKFHDDRIYKDKESGIPTLNRKVSRPAFDALQRDTGDAFDLHFLSEFDPDGRGDYKSLDIVVPKGSNLGQIAAQLVQEFDVKPEHAVEWVKTLKKE